MPAKRSANGSTSFAAANCGEGVASDAKTGDGAEAKISGNNAAGAGGIGAAEDCAWSDQKSPKPMTARGGDEVPRFSAGQFNSGSAANKALETGGAAGGGAGGITVGRTSRATARTPDSVGGSSRLTAPTCACKIYGPISINAPCVIGIDSPPSSCCSPTASGNEVLELVIVGMPPGKLIVACSRDTRRCLSGNAKKLVSSRPMLPPLSSNACIVGCPTGAASIETT